MTIRYVTLADLFPNVSRTTLYRWRKRGRIPEPDLVINGRAYYREDRQLVPRDDTGDRTALGAGASPSDTAA